MPTPPSMLLEAGRPTDGGAAADPGRHPPRRPARQRGHPAPARRCWPGTKASGGRSSLNDAVRDTDALLRAEARRRDVTLELRPAAQRADAAGRPRSRSSRCSSTWCLNAIDASDAQPEDRRRVRPGDRPTRRRACSSACATRGTGHRRPTDLPQALRLLLHHQAQRHGARAWRSRAASSKPTAVRSAPRAPRTSARRSSVDLPDAPAAAEPTPPRTNAP